MPEGDTIYRSAAQLRLALQRQLITDVACHNRRFERPLPAGQIVGQTCTAVEARGKHLLMHLSTGDAIHSHMGMTGSWHLYRPHQRWQKPQAYASLVLTAGAFHAVCFTPQTLELLSRDQLRRHPHLSSLGPDVLDPAFVLAAAASRFRAHPAVALGVALMNQRIVCGIGNVYKSELLFLEQLNPFIPVNLVNDERLIGLIGRARNLMRRNLQGERRQTRFAGDRRLWVYGRGGEPCLTCGTLIQMQRQGDAGRSTYWCAGCQQEPRQ